MLAYSRPKWWTAAWLLMLWGGAALVLWPGYGPVAWAETADGAGPVSSDPSGKNGTAEEDDGKRAPAARSQPKQLNLFWLLRQGGWLMAPIYLMSVLVVAFGIERVLGLRRRRVLPHELIDTLGRIAKAPGGFDPRKAYRACQAYPSSAATVIRSMLLKVGRPHSEVEHAVAEASDREAARLYTNVRWLTLAAAVTPLMGLFGTVWGMIVAFYDTANLPPEMSKAEALAAGIYVALVTTLCGLAVAIPAAILAHFFEGRIQSLFYQIDELLFSLLPQIEQYEGRLRVDHKILSAAPGVAGAAKPDDVRKVAKAAARSPATPTPK